MAGGEIDLSFVSWVVLVAVAFSSTPAAEIVARIAGFLVRVAEAFVSTAV